MMKTLTRFLAVIILFMCTAVVMAIWWFGSLLKRLSWIILHFLVRVIVSLVCLVVGIIVLLIFSIIDGVKWFYRSLWDEAVEIGLGIRLVLKGGVR